MDCPAVQSVQDKLKAGEKINDPKVGRYVIMMPTLALSLKSITGQDFKSHKLWKAWWEKNKATFKVQD
jgi:hypothetical protein